ncbi:MAG: hypothetical protein Q9214_002580 [Letrouitia sp. 1 TL-2023]
MAWFLFFDVFSPTQLFFATITINLLGLSFYRLYLSPISHFPGPKIAALTWWFASLLPLSLIPSDFTTARYQFYYDVPKRGQYIWKIQSMHAQHGPIVRINPCELHISDPHFYDTLYTSGGAGRKRDKWTWDTVAGVPTSTLSTAAHDLHRSRRAAISPFFSMQNVRKLQPVIQEKVDILVQRFIEKGRKGEVINVGHAFSALTNDIIVEYSFATSANRLRAPDFDPSYKKMSHKAVRVAQAMKHFGWIVKLILALPDWMAARFGHAMTILIAERKRLEAQITSIQKQQWQQEQQISKPSQQQQQHVAIPHQTVFHSLLTSSLPPGEKTPARLAAEAQVLVSAGTETTARALTHATYHLLCNPHIILALQQELHSLPPSPPLASLEALPLLSAIIKESLRLSQGLVGRLARVFPDSQLQFNDWVVPSGVPVSMTSYVVQRSEEIFPEPEAFRPERWLQEEKSGQGGGKALEKHLVAFGRGTRLCLGMNLAMAEMYLTIAGVFGRFNGEEGGKGEEKTEGRLSLFETDAEELEMVGEVLVPFVKPGAKGVRVNVVV